MKPILLATPQLARSSLKPSTALALVLPFRYAITLSRLHFPKAYVCAKCVEYCEKNLIGYSAAAICNNHPKCYSALPLKEGFRCEDSAGASKALSYSSLEVMREMLQIEGTRVCMKNTPDVTMKQIVSAMPEEYRLLEWATLMKEHGLFE